MTRRQTRPAVLLLTPEYGNANGIIAVVATTEDHDVPRLSVREQ